MNSPVRAFRAVGGTPRFIARGAGAMLVDADGAELIDYVMSYGAIILGHADERIADAVARAVRDGSTFGAPTEREVQIAERITGSIPSVERVRLVSSGTEATMSAIRLARGVTGRERIVKFAGCYHGHADALLATAGSGLATLGIPGAPGVTEGAARDTIVVPFNDGDALEKVFAEHDIAAVIVEPVAANMGVVAAERSFLERARELCDRSGAVLVFDEVITGFRLGFGGAQTVLGVTPDLTCLGKVIGGGAPIGAFGGRADIMDSLAPEGPVYQAGTLSGNAIAVAAGLAALEALAAEPPYERLEAVATRLARALEDSAAASGVSLAIGRVGSLFSVFFRDGAPRDYDEARAQDTQRYARFFHAMLDRGINLAPGAFEAWFVSSVHTDEHVERTIVAIEESMVVAARG